MRAAKIMTCALALTAFLAPGARADEWNKLTYLTFSAPVQLPGVTLPAGTYAFKLADSWSNRHIVQVFDKDQSKIYGTFLTVSDEKLDPPDKPVVMFAESPAGTPTAVRAWFYPGDTIGDEFVYPKAQAVKIAKATHHAVMATDDDMTAADASKMHGAKVGHVDENGAMTSDDNDNRADAMNATTGSTAASQNAAAAPAASGTNASGTTGTYTAAPRESDRRTGVAQNGDTMNRYDANAQSAGNRTTNPKMAPGGETVTTTNPTGSTASASHAQTGTTASAGTTAQTGTTATNSSSANATRDRRHTGTTAVGTSGQSDAASGNTADNNAKRNRRHLPRTASPLTLVELLSGLSIAGALSVRQLRKRLAESRQ